MINVGIIGIGFMGTTHYKALRQVEGAQVAAISTRDAKKLGGDWREIQGNFGESGGLQDVSNLACYEDWQDLLADKNVDLVDICLSTHLHREVAIAALEAGKHVLVEKPIALTLADADAMIAAAQENHRLLMVGQVLRFFPQFAQAHALVHSGKYGKLLAAHFKRVISKPSWGKDDHFSDALKSGGPALDLHIHDTDFICHLAGVPQSVRATGVVSPGGAINYLQTQYFYGERRRAISCASGALAMPGLPFEHGFDIYLERAVLQFNNLTTGEDIWIYHENGDKEILTATRPDGFVAELRHATQCVASGEASKFISASSARQALLICLKEQQSVLSGEAVAIHDEF